MRRWTFATRGSRRRNAILSRSTRATVLLSEWIQGNGPRRVRSSSNRSRGAKADEGRTTGTFRATTQQSAFFSSRVRNLAVGHRAWCLVLRAGWPGTMLATTPPRPNVARPPERPTITVNLMTAPSTSWTGAAFGWLRHPRSAETCVEDRINLPINHGTYAFVGTIAETTLEGAQRRRSTPGQPRPERPLADRHRRESTMSCVRSDPRGYRRHEYEALPETAARTTKVSHCPRHRPTGFQMHAVSVSRHKSARTASVSKSNKYDGTN
jgi:hypothetical protein